MQKKAKILMVLTFCITLLSLSVVLTLGCHPNCIKKPIFYSIIDDGNITDHIWSSDGNKIAYVKCPDGQTWNAELWVAYFSSWRGKFWNKQLIYTGVEYTSLYDWQDDWILFSMRHELTPSAYNSTHATRELWKIRDDGTDLTQVTFTFTNGIRTVWIGTYPNMGTVSWGRFIPGTDLVYFSAHNGNGWYKAYTCKNDDSDQWDLISGNLHSFTIDMSPFGNKLVFGDDWQGGWNSPTDLYSCDIDGSNLVKIKRFPHRVPPLVLADGDTIVYRYVPRPDVPASLEGNIYAISMDGGEEWTIIDDENLNYPQNYKPVDGQALLMTSNRSKDGNMHVFTLRVDGTGICQLTRGFYNDERPIYSPDGRYILYSRLSFDFEKDPNLQPYPYELVVKRVPPCWHWGHYWHHHCW